MYIIMQAFFCPQDFLLLSWASWWIMSYSHDGPIVDE